MKAVFLDRDGVINHDLGYVSRWEDFVFLPGAIEGMKLLQSAGYMLVVVTNQSGIARGLFDESDYENLTSRYRMYLENQGIRLSGVYHCPHHPDFSESACDRCCQCRKPMPGMFFRAFKDLTIRPDSSLMIGDRPSDLKAAYRAGISKLYLIGPQRFDFKLRRSLGEITIKIDDLYSAANHFLG